MKQTDRSIGLNRILIPVSVLMCYSLVAPSIRPLWGGQDQIGQHRSQRLPDLQPDDKTTGPELSARQKQTLLKTNFEKTKDDAAELADMAKGLRDELNKTSANILSVEVIHKAERIEKLAKKIREEAKGY
jgi:hypothetical protein